jgi:hypothetical protein
MRLFYQMVFENLLGQESGRAELQRYTARTYEVNICFYFNSFSLFSVSVFP